MPFSAGSWNGMARIAPFNSLLLGLCLSPDPGAGVWEKQAILDLPSTTSPSSATVFGVRFEKDYKVGSILQPQCSAQGLWPQSKLSL